MNHFFAASAHGWWSAFEMLSLRSGTFTFAGWNVYSRVPPTGSGATAHFQGNESIDDTRSHGKCDSSILKFEHSHAFCFGPILPRMSSPLALCQRTISGWNSMSKYAASLLEPSSFGTVTLVISACW